LSHNTLAPSRLPDNLILVIRSNQLARIQFWPSPFQPEPSPDKLIGKVGFYLNNSRSNIPVSATAAISSAEKKMIQRLEHPKFYHLPSNGE